MQQQPEKKNPQLNEQKSDLQQATEHVDPVQLADNLSIDPQATRESPQQLGERQQTQFIDESLRTDK